MRKKILATVLAASMALTMAPVLPVNTGTVASAEDAETDVIDTVGTEDCSSVFFTRFSKHYALTPDCDATFTLRNYSNCVNNWENVVLAFTNQAGVNNWDSTEPYTEYAVVRGDRAAWGTAVPADDWGAAMFTGEIGDAFQEIMKAANVTVNIKRSGETVSISFKGEAIDDASKSFEWGASFSVDATDLYLTFTNEKSYQEIISVTGAEVVESSTPKPGADDPTPDNPTPDDPTPDDPTPDDPTPDDPTPAKKTMTVKVTAKKNATKVTGTVSVKGATVKVKVGKKAYKKATVNGKKFTFKVAKLAKGTKVAVKATKSGYKAVTKTVTVK